MFAAFCTSFASLSEEFLQDHDAVVLEHALSDFAAMIQIGSLEKIPKAARAAAFGIRATEDHAPHAAVHDGPGAHGAGLLGDVEIAIGEPPIADGALSLGEGEHLGVRGGVFECLYLVPRSGDDGSLMHDDGSDGHFMLPGGLAGLPERLAHEIRVVGNKNVRFEAQDVALLPCFVKLET